MKYTNEEIYKMYKHGNTFASGLSCKRIYNALKENYLQVVIVKDENSNPRLYNYIPENEEFIHIF